MRSLRLVVLAVCTALVGCGSTSSSTSTGSSRNVVRTGTQPTAGPPPAVSELGAAEHPASSDFPAPAGRTLRQLARLASASAQLGAATGTFVPGEQRLAFGLNTSSGAFIYAPTAVYVAPNPDARASGPYLAPADPMTVAPAYRSKQNSGPGGVQAIYAAHIPLPRKGTYTILSLTRVGGKLIGAPGEVAVAASSPIPNVGQRAPAIATDTPTTVHGDVALLTTRIPPDDMHSVSFDKVLGKRPVALLFSTPQLCLSKVCGPVTDIAVQLERRFGSSVTFIHEEVYVDNQPRKGLRPQLKAFHLETEPWLFTISARGVIAGRLEGAFGLNEFALAVQAALR